MSALDRVRRLPAVAWLVLALVPAAALADSAAPSPAVIAALNGPQALPDIAEGKADAPATIIEYASMTCSHCAAFASRSSSFIMPSSSIGNRRHLYQAILDPGRVGKIERLLMRQTAG